MNFTHIFASYVLPLIGRGGTRHDDDDEADEADGGPREEGAGVVRQRQRRQRRGRGHGRRRRRRRLGLLDPRGPSIVSVVA